MGLVLTHDWTLKAFHQNVKKPLSCEHVGHLRMTPFVGFDTLLGLAVEYLGTAKSDQLGFIRDEYR